MAEDDFERRAGKHPRDAHPTQEATETDPSDYGDPRVAQPGEDPEGEEAMRPMPHGDRIAEKRR